MVAANPYLIGGNLNFGSVPGMDDYAAAYQNALSLNQQNYANILAGYQQLAMGQIAAQRAIQSGYGTLQSDVMNTIQGVEASQRQAITDTYSNQAGATAQSLTSRGLGNTTVSDSVQRGLTLDKQKADIALSNQTAQLKAGYQSQLGLAGLNYANQANMQNTALGGQQLNWMNSVNSPYPNAEAYGRLRQMAGAASAGLGSGRNYGAGLGRGGNGAGQSGVPGTSSIRGPRIPGNFGNEGGSGGIGGSPSPYMATPQGRAQNLDFGEEEPGWSNSANYYGDSFTPPSNGFGVGTMPNSAYGVGTMPTGLGGGSLGVGAGGGGGQDTQEWNNPANYEDDTQEWNNPANYGSGSFIDDSYGGNYDGE